MYEIWNHSYRYKEKSIDYRKHTIKEILLCKLVEYSSDEMHYWKRLAPKFGNRVYGDDIVSPLGWI